MLCLLNLFLLLFQHLLGSLHYLLHRQTCHTLHIVTFMLHAIRTAWARRQRRHNRCILSIRTIQLRTGRTIHCHDRHLLTDSYVHRAAVVRDNQAATAPSSPIRKQPVATTGVVFMKLTASCTISSSIVPPKNTGL